MARRGLGRGLGALIPSADKTREEGPKKERVMELLLDDIVPNKNQPRSKFKDETLDELAESIKEFGVLQPIIVRIIEGEDKYEIIAGERRYRATKKNGISTIPALVVEKVTDTAALEMALIENIHRDDLSPMEQAYCYKQLIDEFEITHQEMSKRIGKSRTAITNILRLLTLPLEVQKMLDVDSISEGHARALLGLGSKEEQIRIGKKIAEKGMSVREVEKLVDRQKQTLDTTNERKALQFNKIPRITEQLSTHLETQVRINIGKKKGKIEIEFDNIKELERVVGKIIG
ncbi:MAG: ParB/RepB/Spo0J family partition protein [Actinobacteria bacterium]|jgi:ParB family chromosome partitioning protein|nr:ParB/RepB/Spo0J family partition protein [Actinomycetota bacterium]MCJ7471224.1 ParB/RepB/Spo0J family partition protein [Actinomycetota bacterium]